MTNRPLAGAQEIASLIDHTLLKPDAREQEISTICQQALEYQFASVCVNPGWVNLVQTKLKNSSVRTCCVAGFPLGANRTSTKAFEVRTALSEGASEIDMVINLGALRSGQETLVEEEIRELAEMTHRAGAILKVILETCLLTKDEKVLACRLSKEAGADFVKTSTGFSTGGATEEDVALLRSCVGSSMGVKASGGLRTLEALTRMVQAGATRIGTSSGVHIVGELNAAVLGDDVGAGGSY